MAGVPISRLSVITTDGAPFCSSLLLLALATHDTVHLPAHQLWYVTQVYSALQSLVSTPAAGLHSAVVQQPQQQGVTQLLSCLLLLLLYFYASMF